MYSIVVVGAGREGKGYLGNVFSEGGWKVTFLDKDPAVIEALQEGQYRVMEYRADDKRCRVVTGYSAFIADEESQVKTEVLDADIITFCLYPRDIPDAIDYLLPMLQERADLYPQHKLTIFPCTNEGGLIPQIDSHIKNGLNDNGRKWYEEQVALRDAVVRRPVGAESSSSTYLEAGVVCPLLVGAPIYADLTGVPWITTCEEDMDLLKELKVHTINTAHAACAYAGYLKGYSTIDEARQDPWVEKLRSGVLEESVPVLAEVYGIEEDKLWDLAVFPETKDPFSDPITRVAYDPLRKLGRHDRLTENACLCLEKHKNPICLIQSIANGLAYDAAEDAAAQKIQIWIKEYGIIKTASKVMGLPEDSDLVRMVADAWKIIEKGKKV